MSEHKIAELLSEGKTLVQHLLDTNAAGSQDHAAVPKSHLTELLDKLHTAEMWLQHIFPSLRAPAAPASEPPAGSAAQAPAASAGTDLGAAGKPVTEKADLGETQPALLQPADSGTGQAAAPAGGNDGPHGNDVNDPGGPSSF